MGKGRSTARIGCLTVIAVMTALAVAAAAGWHSMTDYDTLVSRPDAPASALVIRDTTVVDVVGGGLKEHVDVRVEGTKIVAIDATKPGDHAGAQVIDGAGKYLVPGLIDVHCHTLGSPAPPWVTDLPIPALTFEQLLFAGVTRVFDPGSSMPDIFETRAAIASGELLGPTLHVAGPVLTAVGGHPIPMLRVMVPEILQSTLIGAMTREIASPADAEAAVAELAAHKADFTKMVVDVIPDETPRLENQLPAAIVKAAHKHNLRTVAHIGSTSDAIAAGDAGVAAWIHGVYREEISAEGIAKIASYQIPMVPTMIVFKSYAELGRERKATALEKQMATPARLQSYEQVPAGYQTPAEMQGFVKMLREQRASALLNVGRLHAAGVRILAGSDQQAGQVAGASLHRELALLQEAGLPPLEVIRAATLYAAQFLTNSEQPGFGVVAPGARADLVLVNADPTRDVAALSDIHTVVLGGVALERHPR